MQLQHVQCQGKVRQTRVQRPLQVPPWAYEMPVAIIDKTGSDGRKKKETDRPVLELPLEEPPIKKSPPQRKEGETPIVIPMYGPGESREEGEGPKERHGPITIQL